MTLAEPGMTRLTCPVTIKKALMKEYGDSASCQLNRLLFSDSSRAFHDGLGDFVTAKNPRLNPQALREVGNKGGRRQWVLDPDAHGKFQFATTFMPSL